MFSYDLNRHVCYVCPRMFSYDFHRHVCYVRHTGRINKSDTIQVT